MTGPHYLHLFDDEPAEAAPNSAPKSMPGVVTETIGSGLGTVVVDRSGRLVEVRLDQSQVRALRADRLGELVTEAVNRAESHLPHRQPENGAPHD